MKRLTSKSRRDAVLVKMNEAGACFNSTVWVSAQPKTATLQELWDTCPNASWIKANT